jgi:ABC-type multidrug transport system ATPase subunit
LFFDEPTTGLDSSTAYDVMALVKALADEGRTVLVTLHQPSGQIFDFFTTVLLLSRDVETKSGNIVYFGDSTRVLDYFTSLSMGYQYDTSVHDNVPEFFTDIISGGVAGPTEGNRLMEAYENSDLCDHNLIIARDLAQFTLTSQADEQENPKQMQQKALYGNNILQEIGILLRFKGSAEYRDIFFLASRIFVYWMAALLIVSLYANTPKSPQGLIVILVIFHIVVLIMGCMTLM